MPCRVGPNGLRGRIIERVRPVKVAAHDRGGRYGLKAGTHSVVDDLVVAEEEKCFLLQTGQVDGASHGSAEVVVAKVRNLYNAPKAVAGRIPGILLAVIVQGAVEFAGAALGDLVDHHAANSVLG